MYLLCVVLMLISLFAGGVVSADQRKYVWTYEYQTMPKGASEIEFYETLKMPDKNDPAIKTLEHWVEYEYGLTNHLDIAIYQKWKTSDRRKEYDTKYDGFKLRGRYRFGEKNHYLLDPLVYVEYKKGAKSHSPHELELKLILAKDIGNLNFAYNQILNQPLESDGVGENEFAAGTSYAFSRWLTIGLEAKGSFLKDKYYWGPTISLNLRRFWLACGVAYAAHKRADDVQARVIAGIPF